MELTLKKRRHELYDYQRNDINQIVEKLETSSRNRLLYQLPTGGGKTVVFSEIARQFIEQHQKKVIVLTHRIELCRQTSNTLKAFGVSTKIITSNVQRLPINNGYNCYVAMIETLKNRIQSGKIKIDDIGLVIIDEAHHNSFRKLLDKFKNANIIGVTATPFSSDKNLPMRQNYDQLITGEDINGLIERGYLAQPKTYKIGVETNSLTTGIHGDFTVSSSDELYSSTTMLTLLLTSYEENALGKKTLIFNNGILTSKRVYELFVSKGYPIRHLDNKTSSEERKEILHWFKKTKNAILTSVSILTTGFDEPSVQTVILNRATTSITLYHQMIGRGSRKLPRKRSFTIIDLGNNTERFGEWQEPVDWNHMFENPEIYYDFVANSGKTTHAISPNLREKFSNSIEVAFDVEHEFQLAIDENRKSKSVIQKSFRQHTLMCLQNSDTIAAANNLVDELLPEIQWRIKQYVKCLENPSKSYGEWLADDYISRLRTIIRKVIIRQMRN